MKYSLLILLAFAVVGWAQPVEGPWEIATFDSQVVSPAVCVRGSNADLLFITDDSVRYARFSLISHQLVAGPTAVLALHGWSNQELHDLIRVNDSTWACLVSEDDWAAPNNIRHRVDLMFGGDAIWLSHALDSSVTHYYFPTEGEYWDEGYSLATRVGGGAVAGWVTSMFIMYDLSMQFRAVALHPDFTEDFRRMGGLGLLMNGQGNRAIAHSLTPDTIAVVSAGGPFCRVDREDEWNADCFAGAGCDYGALRNFGLTHSGRRLILACMQDWECTPQVMLVDSLNEYSVQCSTITYVDLPMGTHASFWHPDYGFVVTHASSNTLQLARVDTNGVQTLPTGTLFWRDSLHTFVEANLTISDAGEIVVIWTERQDGDTAARRVMLGSVGWDTPLSTKPQPEVVGSPREFALSAYPNPFNGETKITYDLPRRTQVELAVYNLLGEQVAVLKTGMDESGLHTETWQPQVSSGIYFARLSTPASTMMQKIVYLR